MEKQVSISVLQPTVVNESHPLENVASEEMDERLCRANERERYKDCDDYNTVFCRTQCENGPKEIPIPDMNIDYTREDGR